MRLGVLGGSFDPVHYGHLLLAESCRETCALDEVWLVPAAIPPHKLHQGLGAARHRLAMLELAIEGLPGFVASAIELEREGVSYTVDTLESLQAKFPSAELFLLLGGDSLRDFSTWRQPDRIVELATLAVVRRGHQSPAMLTEWQLDLAERIGHPARCMVVEMPVMEFSSSDIRGRVREGRSICCRVPRLVQEYIEQEGLYRQP